MIPSQVRKVDESAHVACRSLVCLPEGVAYCQLESARDIKAPARP